MQNTNKSDFLGFGLGLRTQHYDAILQTKPAVDWFEAISEDYMTDTPIANAYLAKIRQDYPVVLHGVSLSIGSTDPLNQAYLADLKRLIARIEPEWVSDHICWTGVSGRNLHDLLPMPFTQEALQHLVARIQQVQDYLDQRILLENVSSYIEFERAEMTEWQFLAEMAERADCYILLDINNIYVNSRNHDFKAEDFIDSVPANRVKQFHLAGHTHQGNVVVDTHDQAVIDEVWQLYRYALKRFGNVATMIERDGNIPDLPELVAELDIARKLAKDIFTNRNQDHDFIKSNFGTISTQYSGN